MATLEYTLGGMAFSNDNGARGEKMYLRTFLPLDGFYTNGSLSVRNPGHHIVCNLLSGGRWYNTQDKRIRLKPDGCNDNNPVKKCSKLYRSSNNQTFESHLWMFPQNGFTNRVLQCRIRGGLASSLGIFITDGSEFNSRFVSVYWNL